MSEFKIIPIFSTKAEERAFRESEDTASSECYDFSNAELVTFPNLKPTQPAK